MLTTLAETTESFVALKLNGKLRDQDYDAMIPELNRRIEEHGELSLYIQMENFDGWTPKALWRDAQWDLAHRNDLVRVALVGESNWQKAFSALFAPFSSAEIKHFEPAQHRAAFIWAKFGND